MAKAFVHQPTLSQSQGFLLQHGEVSVSGEGSEVNNAEQEVVAEAELPENESALVQKGTDGLLTI